MILDDEVTVTLPDGAGTVTVPAHVGLPAAGTPTTDGVQVVNIDRLLVLAEAGTLPRRLTSGAAGGAYVMWQGEQWKPATSLTTHRVHGEDHHDSVTLQRVVS